VRVSLTPLGREKLIQAAVGLTAAQAQRAFGRAVVADGGLDDRAIDLVTEEKKQVIRESEALEFYPATETPDDVGGMEELKRALRVAEAVAPCVLWVDELEKAFATGGTDGGTSQRVFGSLLSWMQEKRAPVFVVATANNIETLPPELLRKGRFDEIFFLDLPN